MATNSSTRTKAIRAIALFLAIGVIPALLASCEAPGTPAAAGPAPMDWPESASNSGFQEIHQDPQGCEGCLSFELIAELGLGDEPGLLVPTGTLDDVVQDAQGRFWVGQDTSLKVYDRSGRFLRDVGRAGQGPMEFQYAQPVYADRSGRVHIFDLDNRRETSVAPDFTLNNEKRLPGSIQQVAPLPGGDQFVVNMWSQAPERIGFPLHVINGPEVIRSFGIPDNEVALTPFTMRRFVATDSRGRVFSAKDYEYEIEAWTSEGDRIAGFAADSRLNTSEVLRGSWRDDNPPPNRLRAIHPDDQGRLWIVTRYRKPDWRAHMVEQVAPDGSVALASADGTMASIYHNRVDVLDLQRASIVAAAWRDELFVSFVNDSVMAEIAYTEDGDIYLNIWRVRLSAH